MWPSCWSSVTPASCLPIEPSKPTLALVIPFVAPESFSGLNAQAALLGTLQKPIKFLFMSVLWNTSDYRKQLRCQDGPDLLVFLKTFPDSHGKTHPNLLSINTNRRPSYVPCFNLFSSLLQNRLFYPWVYRGSPNFKPLKIQHLGVSHILCGQCRSSQLISKTLNISPPCLHDHTTSIPNESIHWIPLF